MIALQAGAVGAQAVQDRARNPPPPRSGVRVQRLRSPHSRWSSACCGRIGSGTSISGARGLAPAPSMRW